MIFLSLDRLCTDPDVLGEFEWPGFTDLRARRPRWEHDGYISADSSAVAIVREDGMVVGIATWKPRGFPPGVTDEIGVGVAPEHRGQRIGTAAQDLLVEYLLDHTTAHRIEALTNDADIGEQKRSSASASARRAILDYGLWGRDERSALRWLARSAGAASQVVYLPVDKDVQLARIAHRQATTPHQTFPRPLALVPRHLARLSRLARSVLTTFLLAYGAAGVYSRPDNDVPVRRRFLDDPQATELEGAGAGTIRHPAPTPPAVRRHREPLPRTSPPRLISGPG